MQRVATINQDETDDPTTFADSDSCFSTFNGVQIHHKIISDAFQQGRKRVTHPMILLHGFGASVYSWSRVMKPLANATGSQVVAFDRPAFGLTSRGHTSSGSQPLSPYSMMFSALATMHFIDFLAADKAILVGYVTLSCYTRIKITYKKLAPTLEDWQAFCWCTCGSRRVF